MLLESQVKVERHRRTVSQSGKSKTNILYATLCFTKWWTSPTSLFVCDWASRDHLLPVNLIQNEEKEMIMFFIHVLHNILTFLGGGKHAYCPPTWTKKKDVSNNRWDSEQPHFIRCSCHHSLFVAVFFLLSASVHMSTSCHVRTWSDMFSIWSTAALILFIDRQPHPSHLLMFTLWHLVDKWHHCLFKLQLIIK